MNETNLDNDPHSPPSQTLSRRRAAPKSALSSAPSSSLTAAPKQEKGTETEDMEFKDLSRKSQWIALAVMSGACAAFNGVFAKLTTTELTTSFAISIANALGLGDGEKIVEVVVRVIFFSLNLLFNGIMWALFTKALARGTSTTQVSIINTSSNFMLTAILGFLIFSESLPPLWFLGAALLVVGNVIIGRREEAETTKPSGAQGLEEERLLAEENVELDKDVDIGLGVGNGTRRATAVEEDVLDLELFDEEEEEGAWKNSDDLIGLRR